MRLIFLFILFGLFSCDKPHYTFDKIETDYLDSIFYDSLKKEFGVEDIGQTSDFLGGLNPKYPIVKVYFPCEQSCDKDWQSGGMFCGCKNYIVLIDKKPTRIKNKEDVKELYSPIDSYQEALSYTIIMTGNFPILNDSTFRKEYTYFKNDIRTSNVTEDKQGYYVSLFDYKTFGCGEHPYYSVLYYVDKTGLIKEISRDKAFKDKKEDSLCRD
jgi:hypothetical protein